MVKRTITDLPYEVFDLVLDFLENHHYSATKDILQVQLVCKTLLQVSTERLYKTVIIKSQTAANLFLQGGDKASATQHGRLVKKIVLGHAFLSVVAAAEENERHCLMNLYKYCPNLVEIQGLSNDKKIIWVSLLDAAASGCLKHLQIVPAPKHYGDEAKHYIQTVLALRKTLTKLDLFDEIHPPQRDLLQQLTSSAPMSSSASTGTATTRHHHYLQKYNALSPRLLAEFKNLQVLNITRRANNNSNKNMVMEFDSIVDSCPKLIEFRFIRNPIAASITNMATDDTLFQQPIKAHPNIKSFYGAGKVIGNGISTEYLIQKFPKLNNLTILLKHDNQLKWDDPVEFSGAAMTKFFAYISKIRHVFVEMMLVNGSVLDLWMNMMIEGLEGEAAAKFPNRIIIDYNGSHPYLLKKLLFTKSSTSSSNETKQDLKTTLYLPPFVKDLSFDTHRQIIENIGPILRRLTIAQMRNMQLAMEKRKQQQSCGGGAWLHHIFSNCSSLTELTIITPGYIAFQQNNKKVNESLKSLVIEDLQTVSASSSDKIKELLGEYWNRDTTDKVFNDISLILPKLENLHLHNVYRKYSNHITTIDMPHTSLDTFIWSRSLPTNDAEESMDQDKTSCWKIYIKIERIDNNKEIYYIATNHQSQIGHSSREAFEKEGIASITNHYYVSIRCKSINCLQIKIKKNIYSDKSLSINIE